MCWGLFFRIVCWYSLVYEEIVEVVEVGLSFMEESVFSRVYIYIRRIGVSMGFEYVCGRCFFSFWEGKLIVVFWLVGFRVEGGGWR